MSKVETNSACLQCAKVNDNPCAEHTKKKPCASHIGIKPPLDGIVGTVRWGGQDVYLSGGM